MPCLLIYIHVYGVSPRALRKKRGGWIENKTSKGLMHSNDHIKENWDTIEGGAPPTLLWGNHIHFSVCVPTHIQEKKN